MITEVNTFLTTVFLFPLMYVLMYVDDYISEYILDDSFPFPTYYSLKYVGGDEERGSSERARGEETGSPDSKI